MFLQVSVILLTGGCLPGLGGCLARGVGVWPGGYLTQGGVCPGGVYHVTYPIMQSTPPPWSLCGWYASYWNAFLFFLQVRLRSRMRRVGPKNFEMELPRQDSGWPKSSVPTYSRGFHK